MQKLSDLFINLNDKPDSRILQQIRLHPDYEDGMLDDVEDASWLFCGADFNALEDKIGAVLSGDTNKKKECAQGFDGHSLRAAVFFPEELPEIDMDDKDSVNMIKKDFPDIRAKAKAPSFSLQYGGGPGKIQRLLACSKDRAKQVYDAYHNLYSGLAVFAKQNEMHARNKGYVTCAFGLRLRTPVLKREAAKERLSEAGSSEARSSSNAVTQSWGMLTNRAIAEFEEIIKNSEFSKQVRFCNTIHDAIYLLVKKDPKVVKFVNDTLIKCMEWQEGIVKSEEVKLGAELDIGISWDKQYTLSNWMSEEDIEKFMKERGLI